MLHLYILPSSKKCSSSHLDITLGCIVILKYWFIVQALQAQERLPNTWKPDVEGIDTRRGRISKRHSIHIKWHVQHDRVPADCPVSPGEASTAVTISQQSSDPLGPEVSAGRTVNIASIMGLCSHTISSLSETGCGQQDKEITLRLHCLQVIEA